MRGCTVLALNENYVQVIVLPTIFPLQIHVSACRSDVQRGHTRAATCIRRVGDENQPADEKQHQQRETWHSKDSSSSAKHAFPKQHWASAPIVFWKIGQQLNKIITCYTHAHEQIGSCRLNKLGFIVFLNTSPF